MHGKSELPLTLMFPLVIRGMLGIHQGQEPHPVSLSPITRSTIMNVGIGARPVKAWEMML